MADPATEGTAPKQSKSGGDEKYSREYLADHAQALTGHQSHLLAAALSEGEGDMTADAASKAADKLLAREIDPYEGTPQAEEEAE